MTLYAATDSPIWEREALAALTRHGYEGTLRGRSLIAWNRNLLAVRGSRTRYADGVSIRKIWLGSGFHALSLTPRRLYFDGSGALLAGTENEVLGRGVRPKVLPDALLAGCLEVGDVLQSAGVTGASGLCGTQRDAEGILEASRALGGCGASFGLEADMWRGLRLSKAFYVPDGFELLVIRDPDYWHDRAADYVRYLHADWFPEVGIADAGERVRVIPIDKAVEQLSSRADQSPSKALLQKVFLVPIAGFPGDALPEKQNEVLQLLERSGYCYRVFSYDNRDPKWSSRSQVPSLIQAAGGIAYQLSLPMPEQAAGTYFVGVDVGHAHRACARRISRVVVSVLDPHANFVVAVYADTELDESIPGCLLDLLLTEAIAKAQALIRESIKRVVVLRDGRIPAYRKGADRESPEVYRRVLGESISLVEVRKRDNPIMFTRGSNRLSPAGTACSPAGSQVRFVVAHDSVSGVPNAFKLHMPSGCDGLGIGLERMSAIVAGLCYSPSLGLKAHLPGPIYWADGVASTTEHSYKFKGQRVFRVGSPD